MSKKLRAADLRADGWSRTHVASTLIDMPVVFVTIAFLIGKDLFKELIFGADGGQPLSQQAVMWTVIAVVGGCVLASAVRFLFWTRRWYRVGAANVEVRHGLFQLHEDTFAVRRVQSIDVVEPLLGRMLGVTGLKLKFAGDDDKAVDIKFVSVAEFRRLSGLLNLGKGSAEVAGGVAAGESKGVAAASEFSPASVPVAAETVIVKVPQAMVAKAALLDEALWATVILGVPFMVALHAFGGASWWAIPLAGLGIIWRFVKRFDRVYDFTLLRSRPGPGAAETLVVRRGYLQRVSESIPLQRVHAITLSQPLLWRIPGYVKVEINSASESDDAGDEDDAVTGVLPVGSLSQAIELIERMLPYLAPGLAVTHGESYGEIIEREFADPRGTGMTLRPPAARLFAPFTWRFAGFRAGEALLHIRRGRWSRTLSLVPYSRLQGVSYVDGPLQRRRNLASLKLTLVKGPAVTAIDDYPASTLEPLFEHLLTVSRAARNIEARGTSTSTSTSTGTGTGTSTGAGTGTSTATGSICSTVQSSGAHE